MNLDHSFLFVLFVIITFTVQGSWFLSITPVALILGVFLGIPISEMLGRKRLLLISHLLSMGGYLALYLSQSFLMLCMSRAVQCIGCGLGAMTMGVYLQEISTVRYIAS